MNNQEDKNKKLKELIRMLNEFSHPGQLTTCIMFHWDEKTKNLISMSPLFQATSIEELYSSLWHCQNAIATFMGELKATGLIEDKGDQN